MSSLLDFGAFFSKTGNIAQLDFANKCVDRESTIIALKSNKGIVIAIEKPKHSCLIKNKENKRLFHMSNKIYTAYTGLLTDGKFISLLIKDQIINMVKLTKEISPNSVKRIFVDYLSYFTTTYNLRPIGCNFITAMNYEKKYYLSVSEFNSLTTFYKAYAVGKGAVRAKTELEKEDFSEMEVGQLADHAVRIMYGCHDPVQNNDFDIELCYMNESTNYEMMEVSESDLNILVEKYKHLNVD